jgi:ribosomal protein L16 Arg81 hydroxylase
MNLASSTGTFGNHVDTMEVIYWQCQGQTLWIIDQREQHILKPGDLITVPAGTYHNVIPLTPRLGISMATK